jgi:ubiquinol-cytochrome c reductase cytochrome b subunit
MAFLFFKAFKTAPETNKRRWNPFPVVAAIALVLAAAAFLPYWFSDSLKEAANPAADPAHIIPPWYFFFFEEALRFFTGAYPFWSGVAFLISLVTLFTLPFIDRGPEQKLLLRPMVLGLGAASVVVFVFFSLLGVANARYGEKVVLPAGPRSPFVVRGAQVFAQKNCAYCHQVFGREGRREGPDISRIRDRRRSADWIRRYILNSRLYRPGTTMPRYEIPLEDLEALSAYLLAFDPKKGRFEVVDRKDLVDFGLYLYPRLEGQGEKSK